MKILEREGLGMTEAIFALDQIFTHRMARQMTVIACGVSVMAGLLPAIILFTHDMTIHTGLGFISQVGEPLPFVKGKSPDPEKYPEEGCEDEFC